MFRAVLQVFALSGLLLAAGSCQEKGIPPIQQAAPRPLNAQETDAIAALASTYATIAFAVYSDSVTEVRELQRSVDVFLTAPDADGFAVVRRAWIAARRVYPESEVYRFYDGPIDATETRINTWPIDENYVEAGTADAKPGIIEDATTYPKLSLELLKTLNAKEGETSISTGFHVIEFLLWGRDTSATGPGERPYTDYVRSHAPAAADGERAQQIAARRAEYLTLACALLIQDLEQVRDAWDPKRSGNYREAWLKRSPKEALALVIKGMGSLGGPELSGERLTVAYETKDQENEHSCFSDTTHDDVWRNARGIRNICRGEYQRTDGSRIKGMGLCEVVRLRDAVLGGRLAAEIDASVEAARTIPAPFDRAILGADSAPGRVAIQKTITSLQRQTETLAELAAAFDIGMTLAGGRARR